MPLIPVTEQVSNEFQNIISQIEMLTACPNMIVAVKWVVKTLPLTFAICYILLWNRFTAKPEPVFAKGLSQSLGSKLRHLFYVLGFCLSLTGIH